MSPKLIAVLALMVAGVVRAQNEEDALRISHYTPGGTARSAAMANAFGALGADPSVASINPAGLALYHGSVFSLTSVLELNHSSTRYYGGGAGTSNTRFAINNLALIIKLSNDDESDWTGMFGLVYDRNQSFNWNTAARATSLRTSITQQFADQAYGTPYYSVDSILPFGSGLAWYAWAIDTVPGTIDSYASLFPAGTDLEHTHNVTTKGAATQTSFFYSGNYKNRLYIGASLGINGHRFRRTATHQEVSTDGQVPLKEVSYSESLASTGNGFDLKVGAVYRVNDRWRSGLSVHTPRWMLMSDTWTNKLTTAYRTPPANPGELNFEAESPEGTFSYRVVTPWKTVASLAYLAGKNGTVSVDYEYADMRSIRFKQASQDVSGYDFKTENEAIKDRFRQVHTLRVGTEWRLGNMYYRAGWGIVPNAYKESDPLHSEATKTYAAGVGYRGEHITLDFGVTCVISGSAFFQYAPYLVEATTDTRTSYRPLITFAWRP